MRLRKGALDLSDSLAMRPTWDEFVATLETVGKVPHIFLTSQQGAALAFTDHAAVIGPGHITTDLGVVIWTEDSEEMWEDGSLEGPG